MNPFFLIFKIVGAILKLIGKLIGLGPNLPDEVKVRRVIDGDSLEGVDKDGNRHQIRIRGIDAPELSQEHGYEAKAALQELVAGQIIQLEDPEIDKFGRIAARIETEDGEDPGKTMVKQGHAWACPSRATFTENLAETGAKFTGKGLWSKSKPKAPWKHRSDGPEM